MERDDDQELWDLLGKGTRPELSPFFARNVVRQVRAEPIRRDGIFGWLRPRVLVPAAIFTVALTFAGVTAKQTLHKRGADTLTDVPAGVDPQDYQVVADLDDLIASEDDSVWDEDDSLPL